MEFKIISDKKRKIRRHDRSNRMRLTSCYLTSDGWMMPQEIADMLNIDVNVLLGRIRRFGATDHRVIGKDVNEKKYQGNDLKGRRDISTIKVGSWELKNINTKL